MKQHRFRRGYRKSASKLHRAVGDALLSEDSPFRTYRVYQEYPLHKIVGSNRKILDLSNTFNTRLNALLFDWVILDLQLVIEAHGEQHYKPVDFGGEGEEKAEENFLQQIHRDKLKEELAKEAGFVYLSISYTEIDQLLTDGPSYLWKRYQAILGSNGNTSNAIDINITHNKTPENSEKRSIRLQRARDYRKTQYKKFKQMKEKS